jgi:Domain of unknown function (DUF4365)
MAYTKRRSRQQVMEDRSMRIVRDLLPSQWVVRDYRPDYGIDLLVELFEFVDAARDVAATLGETLFVQVKSVEVAKGGSLRVYRRRNVALGPLREDRATSVTMDVVRVRLETSALATVQAMGAAIPVLLFLVELSTGRLYFVCLNDFVDKVILPRDSGYAAKRTVVIHIPARNRVVPGAPSTVRPLELYAKRAKLYAAFQVFAYQAHELAYACERAVCDTPAPDAVRSVVEIARHFVSVVLSYDFWTMVPEWAPIGFSHRELLVLRDLLQVEDVHQDHDALRAYLLSEPSMCRDEQWVRAMSLDDIHMEVVLQVARVWQRLTTLARTYEELGREWFLPTELWARLSDGAGR